MDYLNIDSLDITPYIILGVVPNAWNVKSSMNTSQQESAYLQEFLESGNYKRIYRIFRMTKEVFDMLYMWFGSHGGLTNSRHLMIEEQVAMFLWTVNFDA